MQFSSIVTLALLPLLALADGEVSTATSTTTLYKTITIQRAVSTATAFNSTSSLFQPTGTGSTSLVAATTTKSSGSSATSSGATVSPSISNSGVSLGAAKVAAAGVAAVIISAFI